MLLSLASLYVRCINFLVACIGVHICLAWVNRVSIYENHTLFVLVYIHNTFFFYVVLGLRKSNVTLCAVAIWSRYVVETDSQIRIILEEHLPETNVLHDSRTMGTDKKLSWLPKVIKDFILPAGFPGGLSCFLEYNISFIFDGKKTCISYH